MPDKSATALTVEYPRVADAASLADRTDARTARRCLAVRSTRRPGRRSVEQSYRRPQLPPPPHAGAFCRCQSKTNGTGAAGGCNRRRRPPAAGSRAGNTTEKREIARRKRKRREMMMMMGKTFQPNDVSADCTSPLYSFTWFNSQSGVRGPFRLSRCNYYNSAKSDQLLSANK